MSPFYLICSTVRSTLERFSSAHNCFLEVFKMYRSAILFLSFSCLYVVFCYLRKQVTKMTLKGCRLAVTRVNNHENNSIFLSKSWWTPETHDGCREEGRDIRTLNICIYCPGNLLKNTSDLKNIIIVIL